MGVMSPTAATSRAPAVLRFVVSVFVLAAAAATAATVIFAGSAIRSDWWWMPGGAVAVALSQAFPVFRFRRSRSEMVSHDEVLFPFLLIVLGPAATVLAWCLGALLSNLMARRAPLKIIFNVGLFTLGSGVGAGLTSILGGPSAQPVGIVAILIGSVSFALSMSIIFSGLIASLEGESWWNTARTSLIEDTPKNALEVLLGVLVAVAVKASPALLPLAAAVLIVVIRTYRRWFNFGRDRKQLQDLLEVATAIQGGTTTDAVESALVDAVYTMTGASSRVIYANASPTDALVVPLELADATRWTLAVERQPPLDQHDRSLVETLARIGSVSFATAVLLEEREKTSHQLAALVRSKEDFLVAVAHEIRTPLTAVKGFASILESAPPDPEEYNEAVAHILEQTLEMTHLVDNLLVASRAQTGDMRVTPTMIDLGREVERAISALPLGWRPVAQLPSEPCMTVADPVRIHQILRNLTLNARHHGGDQIIITVGIATPYAYVEVCDNGPGIESSDVESVFLPFEYRHHIPGRPGSLGLGLSVSRLLARSMKGDLTYRRVNQRTVFALHLPHPTPLHPLAPYQATTTPRRPKQRTRPG